MEYEARLSACIRKNKKNSIRENKKIKSVLEWEYCISQIHFGILTFINTCDKLYKKNKYFIMIISHKLLI